MDKITIDAKSRIATLFKCKCTYKMIESFNQRNFDSSVNMSHGKFRAVFVFDDFEWVVKTGMNKLGDAQCKRELDNYKDAVKDGYSYNFAEVHDRFWYRGRWWYVMKKVRMNADWNYFANVCRDKRFMRWLAAKEIDDLHYENYGWIGGHPVLTDFSGINDDDCDWLMDNLSKFTSQNRINFKRGAP